VSSFGVDGLVSGLDTTSLINQLMQLESAPQTLLKNKVSTETAKSTAYQAVNARFLALGTATDPLKSADTWRSLSVTSSSSSVSATASSAAVTGSVTFDVTSLATAHSRRSDPVTGLTGTVSTTAGLDITIGGVVKHVATATTSLSAVVTAVNSTANLGVTASAVQVSDGVYRLQLTATKTGASSDFSVSGLTVGNQILAQGADASITVGSGAGQYDVTSSSNTFTGVLGGATFTVSRFENDVTLTTQSDSASIANRVSAMIASANSALGEIGSRSAVADGGAGQPLTGDYTVRQLAQNLTSAVTSGTATGASYATYGIQVDRSGKLVFDQSKFLSALAADPTGTQTALTGLATKLDDLGTKATDTTTGVLTQAIQSQATGIQDLNDRISDWDLRLGMRRDTLQRQFTGLEVALGKMKSQSTWLAGQLGSLSSSSG
jgi:flagellar hook-associated protein 2